MLSVEPVKTPCCIYHLDLKSVKGVGFLSPGGHCTTSLLWRLSYLEDTLLAELIVSTSAGGRRTSLLTLTMYDLEVMFRLEG